MQHAPRLEYVTLIRLLKERNMTSMTSATRARNGTSLTETFCKVALPIAGLLTAAIPLLTPMGPVAAGLMGVFMAGVAGFAYGGTINKRAPHETMPGYESYWANTQKKDRKIFGMVGAIFGAAIGIAAGTASDQREHLKSLPEIDAATPARTVTLTLADDHCKGKSSGYKQEITHEGKQFRLVCP